MRPAIRVHFPIIPDISVVAVFDPLRHTRIDISHFLRLARSNSGFVPRSSISENAGHGFQLKPAFLPVAAEVIERGDAPPHLEQITHVRFANAPDQPTIIEEFVRSAGHAVDGPGSFSGQIGRSR